jgi:4-hydroxy-tetrahydrodipicolinate synthase
MAEHSNDIPRAPRRCYSGVVAAVVTPCTAPGEVDAKGFSRLCRILVAEGCDGLFVAASTGEAVFLDEDDRRSLFVAARDAVPDSTTIYAGVSGMGRKQSIRYAELAAHDGANVAVVMAPFFLKISQPEVVEYLLAIADASPIPMAIYHHPRMTTPIDTETVARVAEHQNIVAMKDTSPNLERAEALMRATTSSNISILQGNESLAYTSLQLGAHGMVTALAGVVPEWHAALFDAVRRRDFEKANRYHEQITQLWQMFRFDEVGQSISAFTCAIKLALRRRGWLERLDGMLEGFVPSDAFERLILEHLDRAGVPFGEGRGLRADPPHLSGGDQGAVA